MSSNNWHKIKTHFWADTATYNFLRGLYDWDTASPGTYAVYVDLLIRNAWAGRFDDEFDDKVKTYPLDSRWLRANDAEGIKHLLAANILHCDNLYYLGKCRYFYIPDPILQQFEQLAFSAKPRDINIFTGKKHIKKPGRSKPVSTSTVSHYDNNGHIKCSGLIIDAINSINNVPVNVAALKRYAIRLNGWLARWQAQGKKINNTGRFIKAAKAASGLVAHVEQFRDNDSDIVIYQPVYNPCYTGRIFELLRGLQGISASAKKCLLKGIEYTNFDLVSSQLHIMHYYTKSAQLLDTIKNIYVTAKQLNLPKPIVKEAVYGTIFNCGSFGNKGYQALKVYAATRLIDLSLIIEMLNIIARNCLQALDIFKASFYYYYQNKAGQKLSIKNILDMAEEEWVKFCKKQKKRACYITTREEFIDHECDKKLLAFYIQGLEAYIIHALTIAGAQNGYKVISNQHDGIIVTGNAQNVYNVMAKINAELGYQFQLAQKNL